MKPYTDIPIETDVSHDLIKMTAVSGGTSDTDDGLIGILEVMHDREPIITITDNNCHDSIHPSWDIQLLKLLGRQGHTISLSDRGDQQEPQQYYKQPTFGHHPSLWKLA
jgi:hypothetical protein